MSIDSPHALRVEVARLTKERDEARAQEIYWHNRATEAREACAAARRECEGLRNDIAAWMLDRADQYETDDPIWVGIADLAKGVSRGDAQEAARHGELSADLYSRLGIARAALTAPAAAPGEEG